MISHNSCYQSFKHQYPSGDDYFQAFTHREHKHQQILSVKKSLKMHSTFSEAGSGHFFLKFFLYINLHLKKNYSKTNHLLLRFTNNNEKWSPYVEDITYAVFRDLALYIFHFFNWKYYKQFSSKLYTNTLRLLSCSLCVMFLCHVHVLFLLIIDVEKRDMKVEFAIV